MNKKRHEVFPCLKCTGYEFEWCHTIGGHGNVCAHNEYFEWYLETHKTKVKEIHYF